jgi:hypothetical protein
MTLPFTEVRLSASLHPAATDHAPGFIAAPGQTDVLMVGVAVFLVIAVLAIGLLFLRLHTLPERMAHRGHKLQFEIVAVLGLLALFTHMHIFWVAGLLLALVDLPDFGTPLNRMAGSLEKIAEIDPGEAVDKIPAQPGPRGALNTHGGHVMEDAHPAITPVNVAATSRARPVLAPVKTGA